MCLEPGQGARSPCFGSWVCHSKSSCRVELHQSHIVGNYGNGQSVLYTGHGLCATGGSRALLACGAPLGSQCGSWRFCKMTGSLRPMWIMCWVAQPLKLTAQQKLWQDNGLQHTWCVGPWQDHLASGRQCGNDWHSSACVLQCCVPQHMATMLQHCSWANLHLLPCEA